MLAVETVIPRSLGLVDVRKIVAFRKAHEDELGAFQAAVALAADDLASLPTDIDASALRERVIEATQQHLLKPRDELEASLKLFGLETIKSAMTVQWPVSATVGVAIARETTAPVIGTATGAGIVLASLGVTEFSRRRDLRNKAAAANYLMELRSDLTPRTVLRRQLGSASS